MPRPRNGPLLTRASIVDAALERIDRDGLEGLSMRKLAADLGVDPMSLYHHVPNKDALLRAVVERVFEAMPRPAARGDWRRRVRAWAEAYRSLVEAHPNLVLRIVSDPAAVAVAAATVNEPLYEALERSGLSPRAVVGAADVIVDFVNGYCLALVAPPAEPVDDVAALQTELAARPHTATAAQRRILEDPSATQGDAFRFGLDVILAGLEALARPRSERGS